MAQVIGLKRAWFQNKRGQNFPHYDLSPSKRAAAIRYGATEIDCRELVEMVRNRESEGVQLSLLVEARG